MSADASQDAIDQQHSAQDVVVDSPVPIPESLPVPAASTAAPTAYEDVSSSTAMGRLKAIATEDRSSTDEVQALKDLHAQGKRYTHESLDAVKVGQLAAEHQNRPEEIDAALTPAAVENMKSVVNDTARIVEHGALPTAMAQVANNQRNHPISIQLSDNEGDPNVSRAIAYALSSNPGSFSLTQNGERTRYTMDDFSEKFFGDAGAQSQEMVAKKIAELLDDGADFHISMKPKQGGFVAGLIASAPNDSENPFSESLHQVSVGHKELNRADVMKDQVRGTIGEHGELGVGAASHNLKAAMAHIIDAMHDPEKSTDTADLVASARNLSDADREELVHSFNTSHNRAQGTYEYAVQAHSPVPAMLLNPVRGSFHLQEWEGSGAEALQHMDQLTKSWHVLGISTDIYMNGLGPVRSEVQEDPVELTIQGVKAHQASSEINTFATEQMVTADLSVTPPVDLEAESPFTTDFTEPKILNYPMVLHSSFVPDVVSDKESMETVSEMLSSKPKAIGWIPQFHDLRDADFELLTGRVTGEPPPPSNSIFSVNMDAPPILNPTAENEIGPYESLDDMIILDGFLNDDPLFDSLSGASLAPVQTEFNEPAPTNPTHDLEALNAGYFAAIAEGARTASYSAEQITEGVTKPTVEHDKLLRGQAIFNIDVAKMNNREIDDNALMEIAFETMSADNQKYDFALSEGFYVTMLDSLSEHTSLPMLTTDEQVEINPFYGLNDRVSPDAMRDKFQEFSGQMV